MKHALMIALTLFPVIASGATIHVPGDQPTIQAGIDAAVDGDAVLVADGTYTGDGNRDIDFRGRAITVRSENGAEYCMVDCEGSGSDPHRGFLFQSNEGRDSVLEGLTIQNGRLRHDDGAGILCDGSSPTITRNIITGNIADNLGGGIFCLDSSPMITANTITGNLADTDGGGIYCDGGSPIITTNNINENSADHSEGGAIYCTGSSPTIAYNIIMYNRANHGGGGIHCVESSTTIIENEITGNDGVGIYCNGGSTAIASNEINRNDGAGIYCQNSSIINNTINGNHGVGISCEGSLTLTNNIITRNEGGVVYSNGSTTITNNIITENVGGQGGIFCSFATLTIINSIIAGNNGGGGIWSEDCDLTITNCTVAENSSWFDAGGIYGGYYPSYLEVTNTILWGNEGEAIYNDVEVTVNYSNIQSGWPGEGNIDADPLFEKGPLGNYYLSQAPCQPGVINPCVDTGDPTSEMLEGTTRTDEVQDTGIVDMGYHYPLPLIPLLVVGPGPSLNNPPLVRVFPPEQDAVHEYEFEAYEPDHYGVTVNCGDVDGDLLDEILTGAGPGEMYGSHVRGFQLDGTQLPGLSFLAYGTKKWGVNVAAGDIDADGFDEIITGPGPGAAFGPHVRGWYYDGTGSVTAMPSVSYFAYCTPKWGVNVSAGDIDGDGYDEIVTGPGPGAVYGPHVRGWNVDGGPATAIPGVSFLAYGTNKFGVKVTCGDVDGDGIDEIVTGPGPGGMFAAHVRGWNYDGSSISPLAGFSFFAWQPNLALYGANVYAGADLDGDGRAELVVGCGPDPDAGTSVKVYQYEDAQMTELLSLEEAFSGLSHGTTVAAGRF